MMKRIAAAMVFGFLSIMTAFAQEKIAITEGTEYYVAFPPVTPSPSENPLPNPMQLFITSRYDTKVTISTPSLINDNVPLNRTYTIRKNEVTRIPIGIQYMTEDSETRTGYGIRVLGQHPLIVYTYQAWLGNGELARQIPTGAWDTEYYTMNFYLDRYGAVDRKYRPPMFMIIAKEDNTTVTFTPTWPTEGGGDSPSTPKNAVGTVELHKGEVFVIKGFVDPVYVKEFTTDLSGTLIRSSKPIGVISGHTKVAIMRYPDVLPPTGNFAAEAHFVRNNVHDAMLPTSMAGFEFFVVPSMYTASRVTGNSSPEFGIDDDRGDVVRFIALEDNTTVAKTRQDGSIANLRSLRKGETFLETSVEEPTRYVSDRPVLVGQYGKSYARIIPPLIIGKENAGTQGHPTVESGMPMLEYVPSLDRWVTFGVFHSPEGMDNFLNIVFKTLEADKILIDGSTLMGRFAGSMRKIPGTDYSCVRSPIGAGDHVLESLNGDVKWMAWTYGSLDGLQQGRAYGSPVAFNVASDCDDTLSVEADTVCGDIVGTILLRTNGQLCTDIFDVFLVESNNYELWYDRDVNPDADGMDVPFKITVLDRNKPAKCILRIISKSGTVFEQEYRYDVDSIQVIPDVVDFGVKPINQTHCDKFVIINKGSKEVYMGDIRPRTYRQYFTVTPKTVTIQPGDTVEFTVCANVDRYGTIVDTLAFVYAHKYSASECYEIHPVELRITIDDPDFYASDRDWGSVGKNNIVTQTVTLLNQGNADVVVSGFNPAINGPYFSNVRVNLPLTIARGERVDVQIDYTPNGEVGIAHIDTIWWETNATRTKLYSALRGIGVDADLEGRGVVWYERVIDSWQTNQGITSYDGTVYVSNTGTTTLRVDNVALVGPDASNFTLGPVFINDNGKLTNPVNPNTLNVPINVTFVPTEIVSSRDAERLYNASIQFDYTVSGESKTLSIPLEGTAVQPRLSASGYDYGTVKVGTQNVGQIAIFNIDPALTNSLTTTLDGTMDMELYEIVIPNGSPFVFQSNGAKVLTFTTPIVIGPGEFHTENVLFIPTQAGSWSEPYTVKYNGDMVAEPLLTGNAQINTNLTVSDLYLVYWMNNTTYGYIDIVSTDDAVLSMSEISGKDNINFALLSNQDRLIQVKANEPYRLYVEFTPSAVTQNGLVNGQNLSGRLPFRAESFKAFITFDDTISGLQDTAFLVGDGKYLETTAAIDKTYKVNVGEVVDVYARLYAVPQQVNEGEITQFRLRISYNEKILIPLVVLQDGTQTEGWEILSYTILNGNMIELDVKDTRSSKSKLTQSETPIVGIRFQTLLSVESVSTLPIQMYWVDLQSTYEEDRQYTVFNYIPGRVELELLCAGTLRLVEVGSTDYFIKSNTTNLSHNVVLRYGVGLSGDVGIYIVDVTGKVYDLVRGFQSSGVYEVSLDNMLLPNGVYYLLYVSGDYKSQALKFIKD